MTRIISSVEDDMRDYNNMLFLIQYWVALKNIFKTARIKSRFQCSKETNGKNEWHIKKTKFRIYFIKYKRWRVVGC